MNIGVTGDTHGDTSFSQIYDAKALGVTHLIICGDFGYVWSNCKDERNTLDHINKIGIEILFVDGNHENHKLLNEYPISDMYGGKVHKVRENIIHLIRGEIYELNEKSFFAFGGAKSIDKEFRIEGKSWWKEEIPNSNDKNNAIKNLETYDFKVDYILTHTCHDMVLLNFVDNIIKDETSGFLNLLWYKINYKYWYFGHMHEDYIIEDLNTMCVYKDIVLL